MYINKIDDLLDKVIDDFYNNVATKEKGFEKVLNETNFVKFQKEINDFMANYIKTINMAQIRELVHNEDNVTMITKIIKRYIAYYLFLTVGIFYKGKDDTFINNIIEFTKNQVSYGYKIENFFNSENNANIVNYYKIIRNTAELINIEQSKLASVAVKQEYKETVAFLNLLGSEYVEKNFKLANKKDQAHNIIKTLILLLIYKKNEKKEVFRILESVENEEGEYMFIDIVLPKRQYIDFSSVEQLLSKKEVLSGLAHELWNYIVENEEGFKTFEDSIDDKILKLINGGVLVPIVDDFLLYHKDTEKYDKNITDPSKTKKKEDTKIRYVVSKIDSTSEYYSDTIKDPKIKQNIKKNFYAPLIDRKAILVNNNEEIKIINKLINQGRKSIENNEYYNDLMHYRQYPYINFKDFKSFGFGLALNNTVDAVRSVTFEKSGDHRQDKRNPLQVRVGSEDQVINIVGFMIPTSFAPKECLKVRDVKDIREFGGKSKNGYDLMLKYLRHASVKGTKHQSSVYWMFDLEVDRAKMETYEQVNKLTNQDQVKHIISKLYDDLLNEIYYEIVEKMDTYKELSFYKGFNIINKIEKRSIRLPRESDLYNSVEDKMYTEKYEKSEPQYDEQEDVFHGLSGDILKLPSMPAVKPPKIQTIKFDIYSVTDDTKTGEEEVVSGVCQHNITWENIHSLRKTNPNKYADLLYEFIYQYVVENNEQEYICRSCGFQLNIKKFVTDGVFDDDSQRFITFSMPMEVPLESIPEYEKHKTAIRSIDKSIEKIASIVNIPYYLGASTNIKWRRKAVIKDVIDIVVLNNKNLKKDFKERNLMATKLYGINRDLSSLFVFELDNTIFIYSSKEKDYYKNIKFNNILAYTMILMILDINDSHVTFMTGDKKGICNFPIFEKYGHVLFDGLKIRRNKDGDLVNIKNYKILCYILYIISCMATKYNMWNYEYTDDKAANKKKFNPVIQRIIIHTIVDILNSILEISAKDDQHRLYDIISTKFYQKLTTMFSSETLLDRFKYEDGKTSIAVDKKMYVMTKLQPLKLTGKYEPISYDDPNYNKCRLPKYYIKPRTFKHDKYYNLNNVTNCPDGQFHQWGPKGNTLVCKNCTLEIKNLEIDNKKTEEIQAKFRHLQLSTIAEKYCKDGVLHNYLFSKDEKCNVCQRCNHHDNHKFTDKELEQIGRSINEKKNQQNFIHHKTKDIVAEELEYSQKVIEKLKGTYSKESTKENPYKFIDNFIDTVQSVIGVDSDKNANLQSNIYIIDHDQLGYDLDKPIIISDKDNKITYKSNHPFFKTDVIYYTSFKTGKTEVFYDAITHILLGYKESSKDFVLNKKTEKKIKIKYSLYNKVKLLGYISHFINVKEKIKQASHDINYNNLDIKLDKEDMTKTIIFDAISDRIQNLKKTISEFQRFIYRLKNTTAPTVDKNEQTDDNKPKFVKENVDTLTMILEKYQKKLNTVVLTDEKGEHKIFKHWKAVTHGVYTSGLDDININYDESKTILNTYEINKFDTNGSLLLFYIIHEFIKLINYNQNKFIKANLVTFILEFIDIMFDLFNDQSALEIYDIKRFTYILKSTDYLHDIQEKGHGLEEFTTGIYEEYKDPDDEKAADTDKEDDDELDAAEEDDALDVDEETMETNAQDIDDYRGD
jgi:hypothetical protein